MKMVSTHKKKNEQKRQVSQLNETLIDFIIGNNTNMGVTEKEKLERQASGRHRIFEKIVDNASQIISYEKKLTTESEMQSTVLLWLSKIACMTRF